MEEIVLTDVTKRYGSAVILDHLTHSFPAGEITCILGPSGAGKTTLLRVISALTDYEGSVSGTGGGISYLFQEPRLILNLTVEENLKLVLSPSDYPKIGNMLSAVGLREKKNAYPHTLSGGQAQRVALARAFLYPAEIILMDEPFSSLDLGLKLKLIHLFVELWQSYPRTVLLVTHDVEEAALLGAQAVYLKDGAFAFSERYSAPYPRRYGEVSPFREKLLSAIFAEST